MAIMKQTEEMKEKRESDERLKEMLKGIREETAKWKVERRKKRGSVDEVEEEEKRRGKRCK